MDSGIRKSDAIERAMMERIVKNYNAALKKAVKNQQSFFKKMGQIDQLQKRLPDNYTPEMVETWRQGFIREALRKGDVVERIANDIASIGGNTATEIQSSMFDVYRVNRDFATGVINHGVGGSASFVQYDKRQIEILIEEGISPFTKIVYKQLGKNAPVVNRLQNQMTQAIINGEGQREILDRIRKVTGQTVYQARRVAQTERTRIQSQARNTAITEAKAMGIKVKQRWSARLINTRDTHLELDGIEHDVGVPFVLSDGDRLLFPGDPNGRAENVINCHCVLEIVME